MANQGSNPGQGGHHGTHPRHCICDQCMAEYGTYRIYNQLLDINPNASIIKIEEENQKQSQNSNDNEQQQSIPQQQSQPSKNDKVGHVFLRLQLWKKI